MHNHSHDHISDTGCWRQESHPPSNNNLSGWFSGPRLIPLPYVTKDTFRQTSEHKLKVTAVGQFIKNNPFRSIYIGLYHWPLANHLSCSNVHKYRQHVSDLHKQLLINKTSAPPDGLRWHNQSCMGDQGSLRGLRLEKGDREPKWRLEDPVLGPVWPGESVLRTWYTW